MTPRIGEQNFQQAVTYFNPIKENHNEQQTDSNVMKSKEIDQLAAKFENSGFFTAEASKILAQNILDGSIDVFA
ncbi:MAG: hypothetical protein PF637_08255 [Spirochaetes bacterium]|nr:hypothetical protein [Spirochaetota bacterium]